jgi:hypothetical protein
MALHMLLDAYALRSIQFCTLYFHVLIPLNNVVKGHLLSVSLMG